MLRLQPCNIHFACFLLDGDDLKRYNQISYAAGDQLIHQMSSVLQATIHPGDFVGRWRFGDEFIVLLPNTKIKEAITMGEKLCTAVQETSRNWLFPTTISIGAVQYPDHGQTATELLHSAETALSIAKASGKNQVRVASLND